jgi:hypothetical protein
LKISMSIAKTTAIPLALPTLQALALAHFVKRIDFDTVARFAAVSVVCDDGKSEADLTWLALIALRNALAEAGAGLRQGGDMPAPPLSTAVSEGIEPPLRRPARLDTPRLLTPRERGRRGHPRLSLRLVSAKDMDGR